MADEAPGLFGQPRGKSNRDYSLAKYWGKNQFNSSFPASLVAYMHSRGMQMVYLRIDSKLAIRHSAIAADKLLGIDPLDEQSYFSFESEFKPFNVYYTGEREKIDLVTFDRSNERDLTGLEIKLTALPDNTTKSSGEDQYGCEIVVRPPTICFLACSLCALFPGASGRDKL